MSRSEIVARFRTVWRSESARSIFGNTGWLLSERGLSLVLALTTHVWVARYLGVSGFGALSYATAFIGLFATFTYLGFSGVIIRDLVANPESRDELLGTTFFLKLCGGLFAIAVANILARWWVEDSETRTMVGILSVGLLADGFTVITFWYHSRVEARYAVIASAIGGIGSAALKVVLITLGMPLIWFAVAIGTQASFTAIGLLAIYSAQGGTVWSWRVRLVRARSLLAESWPLALSSVVAMVYLKVDQVMLGHMTDAPTTGVYAVAARLSEVWYVVPAAVANSLFPTIVRARTQHHDQYQHTMQRLYRYMFLAAVGIAIPVSLGASPLIRLLYGEEYARAGEILAVHIWAAPAMFMGAVLTKWLIAEGLMVFSLTRDIIGAALNIALNLILIPSLGAIGAAIATVVSYTVASYLCCFLNRRTAVAGALMTRAITYPAVALASSIRRRLQ